MKKVRLIMPVLAIIVVMGHLILEQPAAQVSGFPLLLRSIMIDPGHGGPDPGANAGDLLEKDIVLDIGLELRKLLQSAGSIVMMTRETDIDLADSSLGNQYSARKRQDMKRRVEMIKEQRPEIVVSVHANAISSPRWSGAQVFYKPGCKRSEELAKAIQKSLTETLGNTTRKAKPGDFYILTESDPVGVIVEVGFLSNPTEAELLANPEYRQRIAWAVNVGIHRWLGVR